MRTALLALVLWTVSVPAVGAQDGGTGTLAGTVLDAKGKPDADASVFIETASGQNPHATRTNAQGRFFFPQLVRGYYDVRASSSGERSEWKHNLEVHTGKQTEVTLHLTARVGGAK
jgi:Carboxypeptidase regulatory-like domain